MFILSCHANFQVNLLHIDKLGFGREFGHWDLCLGRVRSSVPILILAIPIFQEYKTFD